MTTADMSSPETLAQFIGTLEQFNDELTGRLNTLQAHWANLGQSWRDPVYRRFEGQWEQTVQTIETYLRNSPQYVTHLQGKLQQVEGWSA